MIITLDSIKAEHQKIGAMLATYEAHAPRTLNIERVVIDLAYGERYAGIVLDETGAPSHHVILLPEQANNITWDDALAWAAKAGGDLPTCAEQSLLFANLKAEFEPKFYWSGTQRAANSDSAWIQSFYDGSQDFSHKSYEGRARAVRRSKI